MRKAIFRRTCMEESATEFSQSSSDADKSTYPSVTFEVLSSPLPLRMFGELVWNV